MIRRINPLLLLLLLSPLIISVGAQPSPPGNNENNQYNYAKFSPAMAIIIVVLIATLFLMGFFSIYIRHCSDTSAGGSLRRALSLRGRRDPGARGLDAAAIATFPTFTYSEVKDHKIGKGALECAVCLNEFEGDETLRLIPKCDHVFHPECIDTWLQSHVTCPVCRTNLVPQPGDDIPLPEPDAGYNITTDRTEIVIQVEEGEPDRFPASDYPNRPPRSWSVRSTKVTGLVKFRSHSTGHSLVQPGENLDRFTLKLPDEMRKEMMERVVLNRSGSNTVTLPRERSSRRGFQTGGGEGSNRTARFNREAKSDRWVFFSRSTKVVAESGESSGSSGPPLKLPSFNCLEPKTDDEIGLIAENRSKPSV